jgi:hypothetical protein
MKKFGLVMSKAVWKNKRPVEEINYSILLAHVFGEPIKTEQAFMYLFRRYGLPNFPHDDYKDLCAYTFYTAEKDIIVRWRMTPGDYHYFLCAFANLDDYYDYSYRPIDDYHKKIQETAEKDGLVYFGGRVPYSLYKEENDETIWIGNDIQKAALRNVCKDYSDDDKDAWNKVFKQLDKNDKEIQEKYKSIIPYPSVEKYHEEPFGLCYKDQVNAGKKQHDFILSLPNDHFLRRVYFAAKGLFENWKRPTYIRDQYFNLTCKDIDKPKRPANYTNFYLQLGKRKED